MTATRSLPVTPSSARHPADTFCRAREKGARIILALAIVLLAFFPLPAAAAPRTIDDCEKIEAAHLYNLCLAQFGPRAGGARHGNGSSADVPQGPPPAGSRTGSKHHAGPKRQPAKGGLVLRQTRDGRVVAEFSLGAPKPQPTRRKGEGR